MPMITHSLFHQRKIFHLFVSFLFLSSVLWVAQPVQRAPAAAEATGTYSEGFTSYTAKDYTWDADWNIWTHKLMLRRREASWKGAPDVLVDSSGQAYVFWDFRGDVWMQKLDVNGNPLWQNEARVNATTSGSAEFARAAWNSAGHIVVVWADRRDGEFDIYAQKMDTSGNRLWTNDVRVNANDGGARQVFPAVAVDSSNVAWVVWYQDGNNDTKYEVYTQKVSATGARSWSNDKQVNLIGFSYASWFPDVAVDSGGKAVVAWENWIYGTADVYAMRLNSDGTRNWSTDKRVHKDTDGGNQMYPTVGIDASNRPVFAWIDDRGDEISYHVYAQKLSTSGNFVWTTDVKVNSGFGGVGTPPDLKMDSSKQSVITFGDDLDEGGLDEIITTKLDNNGVKIWSDILLANNTSEGLSYWPASDLNGSNRAVIVWINTQEDTQIIAQALDSSGTKQWLPKGRQVDQPSGAAEQRKSAIAAAADGQVVVAWQDARLGGGDIFVQKYDASGSKLWSADVRVNSDFDAPLHANQTYPELAVAPDGKIIVVWADDRADTGTLTAIYAQALDANGNRLWVEDVRLSSDSGTGIEHRTPAVAVNASGQIIVVWNDARNGYYNVYAQRLDWDGNLLWGSEVRVDSDNLAYSTHYSPGVVLYNNGDAMIAWHDNRSATLDVYAQKLDSNGNKLWASDKRLSAGSASVNRLIPSMALDTSGNVFLAWMVDPEKDYHYNIYAQKVNSNGVPQWASDVIVAGSASNTNQRSPDVAADGTGQAIVVWEDDRGSAGTADFASEVFAQKLSTTGSRLWAANILLGLDDRNSAFSANVVVDSQGYIRPAWYDERMENGDIFTQKLDGNGNKQWVNDLQVANPDLFYRPYGIAQSLSVDTIVENIQYAILTSDVQLNGGRVNFFLSNNGGADWSLVTPGIMHVFSTTGSNLRWKVELFVDPIWQRSPVINSLRIEYGSALSAGDRYEYDDICSLARPLHINGLGQAHTFHQTADADWGWFNVVNGRTYILQAAYPQANTDAVLALYSQCGQAPIASDNNPFSREARLVWQANYTGQAYVQVTQQDPNVFGSETGYELSVRQSLPAIALVVAGHDDGNTLQTNIDNMADLAYRTFLNGGVPKADIRYLSANMAHDADGNGLNDDVYAPPTKGNVRDAIQDWARQRGVAQDVQFYLYLVNHGGVDQFYGDGSTHLITPAELNLWLSNLEGLTGAENVNLIIESCQSGSFIDSTALGLKEVSAPNRLVMTATSSVHNAYASYHGHSFSEALWTALAQNQDLFNGYRTALRYVQATSLTQPGWLDDNGDAQATSGDGLKAVGRGLTATTPANPPLGDWATLSDIVGGQATLQAQVRDDFGVSEVYVVIYPPDFVEPAPTSNGITPTLGTTILPLTPLGGDLYEVTLSGLTQTGIYRMLVYALDGGGLVSFPLRVIAQVGYPIYLPIAIR